jgi:sugar phosphate isomerase/epimerase
LYDYEEGFKKLKAHGFGAIDYAELCKRHSDLYTFSEDKYRGFLKDLGECADKYDVEIVQLHGLWATDDKTRAQREESISYFIKEIEGAHYLGCKNVVIHPFLPFGWGAEIDKDKIWDVNIDLFTRLMPYAEKYGVTVCAENQPFTAIAMSTVKEVKKLIRAIDHPLFKACLDTGHANVFHDDIAEDVRLLGDDLATLHVHDNKGNWDQHLIPYMGNIKWEEFLSALKEIGYKGCFTLETMISRAMPQPIQEQMQRALADLARGMADKIV